MLKKSEGIEQSRRRQRFNAHSNSYSSANSQRIRIDINSSEEYLDFANSYLVFDLEVAGSSAAAPQLPRYTASSWIKEIRVKDRAGNMIGENLQDYSTLARCLFEMNVNLEAEKSYLDATEGARGSTGATNKIDSRQYAHRFVTGIFGNKNYFPAHLLGGIQIELDMNTAQDVVMEDTAQATYTINNLAYVCDMVKLKPEVESMVLNQVQQGGLVVDYRSQHSVKGTINTNTSQRFDLGTLNGRVSGIQAVQIIAKASQSVDEKDTFSLNNTSNYRFKLGSKYLSESQIECGADRQAEYLCEWLKSQKVFCNKDVSQFGNQNNEITEITGNKFVIGQGADRSQSDAVLSSLKDKDHNRLELELNYSAAPTQATLYVFAELDKRMVIFPGKQHQDNDFSGQGTNMQ